jgi:hypothetical protein
MILAINESGMRGIAVEDLQQNRKAIPEVEQNRQTPT